MIRCKLLMCRTLWRFKGCIAQTVSAAVLGSLGLLLSQNLISGWALLAEWAVVDFQTRVFEEVDKPLIVLFGHP